MSDQVVSKESHSHYPLVENRAQARPSWPPILVMTLVLRRRLISGLTFGTVK